MLLAFTISMLIEVYDLEECEIDNLFHEVLEESENSKVEKCHCHE